LPIVSAVVVQSTQGVRRFESMSAALVGDQWDMLLEDCTPAAVKVGMLGGVEVARAMAPRLAAVKAKGVPVVLDPVLRSGHGRALSQDALVVTVREEVLSEVSLLTPNIPEAETLLGVKIDDVASMTQAARSLCELGCEAVLLKGGHLRGAPGDVLVTEGRETFLANVPIEGLDVHGTGCHLSTALACARVHDEDWVDATMRARDYLQEALRERIWRPGRGRPIIR